MGAAESRKQARDDVGENGCCHDLTATNELSRVYWPGLPDQVSRIFLSAAKPSAARGTPDERHERGRGSCCHDTLRLVDATGPRASLKHPHHFAKSAKIKEMRSL